MLLGTALLVLNLSVGVVKVITGRIGPLETEDVHTVFAGGNIYPSGHVSNTVVLYGVLAMLATVHRRFAVIAAVWITLSVGLCTLYLNTHWFSDVVGGWLAGSLVVVSLPWVMPYPERAAEAVLARLRRRRAARAPARRPQLGAVHREPVGPRAVGQLRSERARRGVQRAQRRAHSRAERAQQHPALGAVRALSRVRAR